MASKLKVVYLVRMFSQECTGTYARFHDIIHTLQQMADPPWEFKIIPSRRLLGDPSSDILFQDGNIVYRYFNFIRNMIKEVRNADIVHVVQGDLSHSLLPPFVTPGHTPLVAGPNLSTFVATKEVTPLLIDPIMTKKGLAYRLRLSRHWRNRVVFAKWSPLSRRYNIIIAFSQHHRELYEESGINPDKVKVLPTGVRSDLFNPVGEKIPTMTVSTRLTILYVATLKTPFLKGLDVLFAGLAYLENEGIPFHAWIAGGTADEVPEHLHYSQEHVSYLGFVPRGELGPYYRSSDVFVNPSRFEVDGTTSVEALACGTPVIGSDIASFQNKNTLTFHWASGQDLGKVLKIFWEQRSQIKQEALLDAPKWHIDVAISELEDIYRTLH